MNGDAYILCTVQLAWSERRTLAGYHSAGKTRNVHILIHPIGCTLPRMNCMVLLAMVTYDEFLRGGVLFVDAARYRWTSSVDQWR